MNENNATKRFIAADSNSRYRLLALDTSTKACSVALLSDGKWYVHDEMTPQTHANRLLFIVEELLAHAKCSPQQLDALVFGEGPGAFTGIRIACGAIQGLALGWNKPVLAMSSLASMAHKALLEGVQTDVFCALSAPKEAEFIWVALLDARMQEIYLQQGACHLGEKKSSSSNDTPVIMHWQQTPLEMVAIEAVITKLQAIRETHPDKPMVICGDVFVEYPQIAQWLDQMQAVNMSGLKTTDLNETSVNHAHEKRGLSGIYWCESFPSAASMVCLAIEQLEQDHTAAKNVAETLPKPVYLRNQVAQTMAQRQQAQAQKK